MGVDSSTRSTKVEVRDADGRPLRPAKLWNDTEWAPDAASLVDQLGGTEKWADAYATARA
jgi:xylulokinase